MAKIRSAGNRNLSKKLNQEKKEQEKIERAEKWMQEKSLPKKKPKIFPRISKPKKKLKKIPQILATKKINKPERVISEKIVLDTNVIIDSWEDRHVKGMHQLLKKRNIRIILTETALGEAIRKLKKDKKTVREHLEKRFGNRLEIITTTPEMIKYARKMEKKYSDLLHNPDSIIFAAAKKMDADLITNDNAVKKCCTEEKINVFDHRLVKIVEKKNTLSAKPSNPKKTYYDKNNKKISAKEYRRRKKLEKSE